MKALTTTTGEEPKSYARLRATPMSPSIEQRMEKRKAHVRDILKRGGVGGEDPAAFSGVFIPNE